MIRLYKSWVLIFLIIVPGNKLIQLDFRQNYLGTVPSIALRNRHHLILNLNNTKENGFYAKAFEDLDVDEILTLYNNEITSIEAVAFKGLDKYDISIYLLLFYSNATGHVLILMQIMPTVDNENVSTLCRPHVS